MKANEGKQVLDTGECRKRELLQDDAFDRFKKARDSSVL